MRKTIVVLIALLLSADILRAQTCTAAGQTPSSAIVLCGSVFYSQASVPMCGSSTVPVPCPATSSYMNTNPFWFRMRCFNSGTLGFIITPNDINDNYDWQLFDVSGHNDDDALVDPSLFLACNWCSDPGETGASIDGNNLIVCTGTSQELFSKMPNIIQGHEYLLMVSHRNPTESGFQIVVTGGTGSVTDPIEPDLYSARLSCNSTQISVFLNKDMNCATIASDGSDFVLSSGATIVGANYSCIDGQTGMIVLNLSNAIPPGNYTLAAQNGFDGNTIIDRCNRSIPVGHSVPLMMPIAEPAKMDSLTTPGCSPDVLHLVFRKPIQCNSIAFDASDFTITGPQSVSISNVTISCNTQTVTTQHVTLHLSTPIINGGLYQINLVTGSDGNTIIDECGSPVAPSSLPFTVKASVSAAFNYTIRASCKEDTIYFSNTGTGATSWHWTFDNTIGDNSPNQVKIYPATGQHLIQLMVTNGSCSDTARDIIKLDNKVVAGFEIAPVFCPEDVVKPVNTSTGTVHQWQWNFGNSIVSTQQTPQPFHYPITSRDIIYTVTLTASNTAMNCKDSISKRVQVLGNCFIAVPTAFTPNGDGLNDFLNPNNAIKADDLLFRVYNRIGQLVFETRDWTRKWDGKINGVMQQTGVYAWTLTYTHHDTGEKIFQKGTTVLIR